MSQHSSRSARVGVVGVLALLGTALVPALVASPASAAPSTDGDAARVRTTTIQAVPSSLGDIPDNAFTDCNPVPAQPLVVAFDAADVPGDVTDVSVSLTMTHGYVQDLTATLSAPGDGPSASLFDRPGVTASSDCLAAGTAVGGTYTFTDAGQGTLGAAVAAASGGEVPTGTFRASGRVGDTEPPVSLAQSFDGVAAAGTWTVTLTDSVGDGKGAVTAASISIVTDAVSQACDDARADLDRAKAKVKVAKQKLKKALASGDRDRIKKARKQLAAAKKKQAQAKADVAEECSD